MKDIAEQLNLSINTVSKALRDLPGVNAETKRLVLETASKLRYRKNRAASSLRTNQSNILGVVITDFRNPAISSFVHGAETVALQSGYTLMLGSSGETAELEATQVKNMLSQGVDGLLLIPSLLNKSLLSLIEQEQMPYVLAIRNYDDLVCNYVRSDDLVGAATAAEHFYQLGHRKFLYISGLEHISSTRDRYTGFFNTLASHGLSASDIQTIVCSGSREDAQRVTEQWLRRQNGTLSATAIFAFSDYVACGAYAALHAYGIRIPEDISIIGYDNNEYSSLMMPALSSVDNHFSEIGRCAMARLVALLKDPEAEPEEYTDIPELVLRSSTAPPKTIKE